MKTPLKGKQIAVIVGHQPGGGAAGEREFNKEVAEHMKGILEDLGADVFYYQHKLKSYGARQRAMAAAVKSEQPSSDVCIELHYDAVSYPGPAGHHFQYRGAKKLAEAIRDEFQKAYPDSKPRRDNGIMHNTSDNGSGFLKAAPGWACLTEPFFRSNPEEWEFFKDKQREIAEVYCRGIARFLTE